MKKISTVERANTHERESGKFVVIWHHRIKAFTTLISAFIFYVYLESEASLWNITIREELLEKKCLSLDYLLRT